jgi:hypothetical protein
VHELLRKNAFDAAAKGMAALREFYGQLSEAQATVLRPIVANLKSAAQAAEEEAEQQRQARDELQRRDKDERRLKDPFGQDEAAAKPLEDPFGYSDLRDTRDPLTVPLRKMADGCPDWEETAADMRAMIATLTDPADTAVNGRFKRDNGAVLDQMRLADRDAWSSVEHRLGDRDRELREAGNG